MTRAEIETRATLYCSIEGWADVSPAPNWTTVVGEALKMFSKVGEYVSDTFTFNTVAGTSIYAITSAGDLADWVNVNQVLYGTDSELRKANEIGIHRMNALWRVAANSSPGYWWCPKPNYIRLWPTPDAITAVTVAGIRCEDALASSTDIPVAPAWSHEGIALLAAAYQGRVYATSDAGMGKVAAWEQKGLDFAKLVRSAAGQQMTPLQRTVSSRKPDRLQL